MNAIGFVRDRFGRVCAEVDQDECVDCGVCIRSKTCPVDALVEPVPVWPRSLRGTFSNPLIEHKETRVPGRGTEEMKTNDVTGRYRRGEAGMAIEMGRPGTGARFSDIERVAMAIARLGVKFEPKNPLTGLMADPATGRMKPDILGEKVLSAIIEVTVPLERMADIVAAVREVTRQISTVCSFDLTARADPDGTVEAFRIAAELGLAPTVNGKTNLGLGRPLFVEEAAE
jgi:hypothetical protein